MLAQRLEDGEAAQVLSALCPERAEGFGAGISLAPQMALAEISVEKGHGPALQRRDRRIIHQLDLARLRQGIGEIGLGQQRAGRFAFGEIRDGRDIHVKRVQEQAAAGRIGAGPGRLVRKQGVQRIHAHGGGAGFRRPGQKLAQIAEIADAPIARRTQGIELGGKAPGAMAAFEPRRKICARRSQDEMRRRPRPRIGRPSSRSGGDSRAQDRRGAAGRGAAACRAPPARPGGAAGRSRNRRSPP